MILGTSLQDSGLSYADWHARNVTAHNAIRDRFKPLVETLPGVWVREPEEAKRQVRRNA